ncbi:MAG: hypothetical protein AAGK37_20740 [Pseudomonadota bacterium]
MIGYIIVLITALVSGLLILATAAFFTVRTILHGQRIHPVLSAGLFFI